MKKKQLNPFEPQKKKESSTYFRLDEEMLDKIDLVRKRARLRTRSETIRAMIKWCFDNNIESQIS